MSRFHSIPLVSAVALSAFFSVAIARPLSLTLTPANPEPGNRVTVRIVDVPPGCPGDPRGGRIAPFRYDITMAIDASTPPGARLVCDFTIDLGVLTQGRYTIEYNNALARSFDLFSFDVFPGGGGLIPNPIPALSGWSLGALALLIAATASWTFRREKLSAWAGSRNARKRRGAGAMRW